VIILFGGSLKPAVIRSSEFAILRDIYIKRTAESIITTFFFHKFYKTIICKPTGATYDSAMRGWYTVIDYPLVKVDVNNMYPTTLLQLVRQGICKAEGLDVVMRFMAYRTAYYSKYLVIVNVSESEYAIYRQIGRRCRSRDVADYIGKEPTDYKTAVETLKSSKCTGIVVSAKDIFKYTVLMAIGRIKHYSTATWHTIISEAHSRFWNAVNRFRLDCPDCLAGIYVDTAFILGNYSDFVSLLNEAGYGAKIDGIDSRAVLINPVNYLVASKIGAWLIGMADKSKDAVDVNPDEYPTAKRLYVYKNTYVDKHVLKLINAWANYVNSHIGVKLVKVLDRAVVIRDKPGIYSSSFRWGVIDRELMRIYNVVKVMFAQ